MTRETEISEKMTESANTDTSKTVMRDERAAAESDMKTEEKDRQTVTMTVTEAVTAAATKTDVKMKRTADFEFKKNIRLLTATQMMLKVLFIFQMSLLCFHVNQSDVR